MAKAFLLELLETLKGKQTLKYKQKWDGAPAFRWCQQDGAEMQTVF